MEEFRARHDHYGCHENCRWCQFRHKLIESFAKESIENYRRRLEQQQKRDDKAREVF